MVDFLTIATRVKNKSLEIYPKFWVKNSKDLMIRGGDFYAIWDEERQLWSTSKYEAIELIDRELARVAKEKFPSGSDEVRVLYLRDSENGMIDTWNKFCKLQMPDLYVNLDEKLIFSDMVTAKEDYASKRLAYAMHPGPITNYEHLMNTLYSPSERHKIEWAIGSVISGDSKTIQKFLALYGSAGTGKSTVIGIIKKLFDGYYSTFSAKSLGSSTEQFSLEAFVNNPLVAIDEEGDLSHIESNSRLNSLISHDEMLVNAKHKSLYSTRFKSFLFISTNEPIKITNARSGLIRRLIDVSPTGNKLPTSEYFSTVKGIDFELGAIAAHCLEVYEADKHYYDSYEPTSMIGATNDFYGFVDENAYTFIKNGGVTLKAAWAMYKEYCTDANVPYPFSKRVFQEELKTYFKEFHDRYELENGERVSSYYLGFKERLFEMPKEKTEAKVEELPPFVFKEQASLLDELLKDCPAQYAVEEDGGNCRPATSWEKNRTLLKDLDTHKLHYVLIDDPCHIFVDFDKKDENGKKSLALNMEAASKWPKTYAELSKSGQGIHLHYIYDGDPSKLERLYEEDVEIKVQKGKSSLRRMLTKCNDIPVAHISSGLPLKKETKMLNKETIENEKHLRRRIGLNLNKAHGSTRCSIDFIYKDLEQAYASGMSYDVSDLKEYVYIFAANSTNQSDYCMKLVSKMRFASEDKERDERGPVMTEEAPLAVFDIEVFPNVIFVNWKRVGEQYSMERYINPKPSDIEFLTSKNRLIGFNNLRYDNIILYAILIGWSIEQIYELSNRIVNEKGFRSPFRESKNLSYTDIYDYCSKKQSLKKWEVELRHKEFYREVKHKELGLRWDQPVPEKDWVKVSEYCDNDVYATEKVWMYTQDDFLAREILADLAGMTVNDTTNNLVARIVFGKERHPKLLYTNLATGERM